MKILINLHKAMIMKVEVIITTNVRKNVDRNIMTFFNCGEALCKAETARGTCASRITVQPNTRAILNFFLTRIVS